MSTSKIKIKIVGSKGSYYDVSLVERTGVDPQTMSKEEFVEDLSEDIDKAFTAYKDLQDEIWEEDKPKRLEATRKRAEQLADRKWKLQSRKNSFIQQAIRNSEASQRDTSRDISYFDFDASFGSRDYVDTIHTNDNIEKKLQGIWDCLQNRHKDIWEACTGWNLIYSTRTLEGPGKFVSCFRPYIRLKVSEGKSREIAAREKEKADAMSSFYNSSEYKGD